MNRVQTSIDVLNYIFFLKNQKAKTWHVVTGYGQPKMRIV